MNKVCFYIAYWVPILKFKRQFKRSALEKPFLLVHFLLPALLHVKPHMEYDRIRTGRKLRERGKGQFRIFSKRHHKVNLYLKHLNKKTYYGN